MHLVQRSVEIGHVLENVLADDPVVGPIWKRQPVICYQVKGYVVPFARSFVGIADKPGVDVHTVDPTRITHGLGRLAGP